jgi:tetratricopeptide (TPR) repeat protein
MKCPKCQTENPEGVKFCGECGQSLSMELTCPQCGHKNPQGIKFCYECGYPLAEPVPVKSIVTEPTSFAGDRYQVKKFLGEGGKKKVYLAYDTVLDRDVAFYLIKTEKLDESSRTRIKREAQAMGKLGDHPNIMSIFDFGDHEEQPYMVAPLMAGGDVEGLIKKATDHKLPLDKAIEISKSVCKGLEFAHARGVIHRDIKPGNIWMSADGTVKIGDFGLAVSVDLSRLTQDGMMVGTVSYMPPEQAMGGKVTAKADLYSLGAMLYEMVTGRPPFVGDDSVAIIGQHINTQPISPSWHRADLPPALETLIIQLLEKDPEKRPGSATVVLQALESITTGKVKEESVQKAAPAENPLYRRVFVGRERELKQLQSAFDGAISGQGALMMVVGEPGIGKTAICEQLATYVTLRGGKTLWGHCYEEGSLSLPYLAFVEAMRSYVLDREPEDLKKELGSGATDVARIVSEIREKIHVEPREAQNPEEDRYRLMQAVTSFLFNAAIVKPILVILEDLHDADKGTLDMLSYVSRNLTNTRLLIVGTYRDVEVDRNHPLSAALAELRRVSSFGRVLLRGLNIDEVRRMLASITQEEIPISLAEAVHRQTEGNPLFIQEVVRYLTEYKLLIRAGGQMITTGSTPLEMNIPEGLRDVIGKRLSSLSEGCNRLLSIAAVIGRDFRFDVLHKVADVLEEEIFSSIEEAKRVAIIEERSTVGAAVIYRFTHAFFRIVLYEENIAPRRIRLHQQVARALEQVYASRLQEHAAELAEHFSYSSEAADLTKAVHYGEMAAQRATDVYDYGETVRLLQQALKVQEVLDPNDKSKRCDLLVALGWALTWAGEPRRAIDVEYSEALSLAEQIGDNDRAASVCWRAIWAIGLGESRASRESLSWAEKGDRYAKPGTIERAWADFGLGTVKCYRGLQTEGLPLIRQSLEQARTLGDTNLIGAAGNIWLDFGMTPWSAEEALRVAEEMATTAKGAWVSFINTFSAFLQCGRRKRAEEVAVMLRQRAAISGDAANVGYVSFADATLAFVDGRLEECLEIADRHLAWGRQTGYFDLTANTLAQYAFRSILYLGRADERPGSELWKVVQEGMNGPLFRGIPLLAAHLGRVDEVNAGLERMLSRRPKITSREDIFQAWLDIAYLEAAVLVGHHRTVELLLQRFIDNTLSSTGKFFTSCIPRQLGSAAAFLNRYDVACKHYQEAIRICTKMKFRPELALTQLQLAELLLDHYPKEKAEAIEHLDFVIKEFREMKMQPYLERALRRKDILKA